MLLKLDLRQVPPTTNGALAIEVCITVCIVIDPEFGTVCSLTLLTSDNLLSSSPKAVLDCHVPFTIRSRVLGKLYIVIPNLNNLRCSLHVHCLHG